MHESLAGDGRSGAMLPMASDRGGKAAGVDDASRDLLRIELRHLRYFIAAADHGSFHRASNALGIRESAVSRRIRDLESRVGASLFIRDSGGVRLTYAGEQFVAQARKAINQLADAIKDVGLIGRGEAGVVRIGIFSSLASGFLAELVQIHETNHGSVRLEFFEGGASDHVPAIRRRHLDIAFLTRHPAADDFDVAHLWDERVFVAFAEGDELAVKEVVAWEDVRDRAFVVSEAQPGPELYDYLIKHIAHLGVSANIERHSVYRDTLMQIVAGGRKLTLTSEATTAVQFPGVIYRPLSEEILKFCAIWLPNNANPAFRRFLSLAKSMSHTLLAGILVAAILPA
jgi:DNA-binding transcriptional LysR family regulator